jgi:hypothetical protein
MRIVVGAIGVAVAGGIIWLLVNLHRLKNRDKSFWTKAALAAFVLYLLGLGPAVFILQDGSVPELAQFPVFLFYFPLFWLVEHGPKVIHDLFEWYAEVWHP